MRISTFLQKKPETKSKNVDIREAFTLWDVLNSKYMAMEKILVCKSFVHDTDLKLLLVKLENETKKNIEILQKQMNMYNIISPNKNRVAAQNTSSTDLYSDEFIAMETLLYEQEHVENMLISLYSLITNDNVRSVVKDMLFRTLDTVDGMMDYILLRGWAGIPPAYKHIPAKTTENIHCGEAGYLWDLLTYRYDTLHFTEILLSNAHDADLKLILEAGVNLLAQQINQLEKELIYYGIPVPKRPSDITVDLNNKELWDDSHIYRMILMGMQGAGSLHVRSFKKLSKNQRLRGIMKKLLRTEVDKLDDTIRYGKLKGWLHSVPVYGP